jgi:hypothetical protein
LRFLQLFSLSLRSIFPILPDWRVAPHFRGIFIGLREEKIFFFWGMIFDFFPLRYCFLASFQFFRVWEIITGKENRRLFFPFQGQGSGF